MGDLLAALNSEFLVHRTRLPRVTPFPSWNGVIRCSKNGLVSILSECGRVYLLQLQSSTAFEFEGKDLFQHGYTCAKRLIYPKDSLSVVQILDSEVDPIMSMCQAWTCSGSVLVVARNRHLTIYRSTDESKFQVVGTTTLRFAATSVDVREEDSGDILLVVGSTSGVMVFTSHRDGTEITPHSALMDDMSVAVLQFSPDGNSLAIGTIDGRVMVLRRTDHTFSGLDTPETFVKVLAAPRVTSLTFSPASDKLIASTRKGNVYVLTRDAQQWVFDDAFASLVANPKGGATSQTLSCWWGMKAARSSPIFVIGSRPSSCSVEVYDVCSHSLLHTLQLNVTSSVESTGDAHPPPSTDRHLMGITFIPTSQAHEVSRLLCMDSDAYVFTIAWPFLTHACPL